MDSLLEIKDAQKIIGEIYKITNLLTNKMYIGQTRSHYLNKGKYRPFGHIGRFKKHLNEASRINIKCSCKYLNSTINKYGVDNFKCELITTCPIDELDYYETKYISELDTKYPNGYNLTNGGQKCGFEKGEKVVVLEEEIKPLSRAINGNNLKRTEKTKQLISKRLIDYKNARDLTGRKNDMERVQKIHAINRFDKYKDIHIDSNNIDKYISIIKNNTLNYEYIRVTINKKRTTFVGQYETIEEIKKRARIFILEILEWQRIQTAGTSLEPSLPLTCGNACEDLV
jgi:group I intron endonuclease